MSASNVNVVVITGNCTQDPELRYLPSGTAICEMRVAVNGRRKNGSGEWVDKANYFNVVSFGKQAENHAEYLAKGRPVAIEGRLDWRDWDVKENGEVVKTASGRPKKREAVQIIANSVQYLGSKPEGTRDGARPAAAAESGEASEGAAPDPLAMEDAELAQLDREELDEIAIDAGVENPDEYRQRRQVVNAIREAEAERATSDFGPVSGVDMSEPEF
jgi:single-strand DNA-binding protein